MVEKSIVIYKIYLNSLNIFYLIQKIKNEARIDNIRSTWIPTLSKFWFLWTSNSDYYIICRGLDTHSAPKRVNNLVYNNTHTNGPTFLSDIHYTHILLHSLNISILGHLNTLFILFLRNLANQYFFLFVWVYWLNIGFWSPVTGFFPITTIIKNLLITSLLQIIKYLLLDLFKDFWIV